MSCALEMDSDKEKELARKMAQTVSLLGKTISYKKYQKKISKKIGPVLQNLAILLGIIVVALIVAMAVAK